eukprot:GHVS01073952.1.p1 GENE.GHVS01073952.1~~GHVS01073952.1.p1  ORF type:complete len:523 (+),score=31.71 GHVS01073952.1:135-1703(+)
MANRSFAAHFLLIVIAALLLLALSAAADKDISALLKIPKENKLYKPLAVEGLELSIDDEQLLKVEAKNGGVVATVIRSGKEVETVEVEGSEPVILNDNLLVLRTRTAEGLYMLTLSSSWFSPNSISVKAVRRNSETEAEEIVKLLKKKGDENFGFFDGLRMHLVRNMGKFSNSGGVELMLHDNDIYASYYTKKGLWYKVVTPAYTRLLGKRQTIRLDCLGVFHDVDAPVVQADVTLEEKDGEWTFSAVFVDEAAIRKRIAETMFSDDTWERRELFANSLGSGKVPFSFPYTLQFREGLMSDGYTYATFWETEDKLIPEAEGAITRLSMDTDVGKADVATAGVGKAGVREATFHLLQGINKPSYVIICECVEELWTCPTLKDWSKKILTTAFNRTELKDFFKFPDFWVGFPADDAGKISKRFGYKELGVLIEATPSDNGDYKVSAKCVPIPDVFCTSKTMSVDSVSMIPSHNGSLFAKLMQKTFKVKPAQWKILSINTSTTDKVEVMKIVLDKDGTVTVFCDA